VFVPLRAYYKVRDKVSGQGLDEIDRHGDAKVERIVVDLHDDVEARVRDFDADHVVRVISGGPGSGKSSFAKMIAAFIAAEIEEVQVIFVPLHHFDPSDNLIAAMEQFVKEVFCASSVVSRSTGMT